MADEKAPQEEAPKPEWKGSLSSAEPLKAPDGHETLSKEDIKNRG
jgi:hypothetical protein